MGIARVTVRNVAAGAVGNVLEWYDFAVYGFLAPILGARFFPAADPLASLLGAFSVFAIGYAARPIGGMLFGHVGDTRGRKPALLLSVLLMGASTCAIGLLPDRAQIGDAAAVLLVVLRMMQGLSVGGEFTGSIVFIAEHAARERRGLAASWAQVGCTAGFLLGSVTCAMVGGVVGEVAMAAWGWRIPFLLGAVIALLGLVIRRQITESPVMSEVTRLDAPVINAVRNYWRVIARLIALIAVGSVGFYLVFVYAAAYLTTAGHLSTEQTLVASSLSLLVMLVVTPLSARTSDAVGRKPLLYLFAAGVLVGAWPLWWLLLQESFALMLIGQSICALLLGVGFAGVPAAMVEMLPAEVRCSGIAVGYNSCLGLLGGTAPLVATWLVARTGDAFAPVWYWMALAVVSLAVLVRLPETAGPKRP